MANLADQINAECCGHLMGAAEKQILIAEVAELERVYEALLKEMLALEDEIVAVTEQVEAKCRRVFHRVYNGAESPDLAWEVIKRDMGLGYVKSSNPNDWLGGGAK